MYNAIQTLQKSLDKPLLFCPFVNHVRLRTRWRKGRSASTQFLK
jgi:hypothetical protein